MNFQAASGDFDLAGIAQVQPPEGLTLPLPLPSWVGIAVWPSTSDHCGHGFAPVFSQLLYSHEPSSAIASLEFGSRSLPTLLPQFGSSDCFGCGARPSVKTVLTKFSESLKPWLPTTHFFWSKL